MFCFVILGVYCRACYEDINNMCTACMKPVEYGDLSDIDEERDSSRYEIRGVIFSFPWIVRPLSQGKRKSQSL